MAHCFDAVTWILLYEKLLPGIGKHADHRLHKTMRETLQNSLRCRVLMAHPDLKPEFYLWLIMIATGMTRLRATKVHCHW